MDSVRIEKELRARGASLAQAKGYTVLVRRFERESHGVGELHHILPLNCGWWKQHHGRRWNHVVVDWGKHIALHAYLFSIFPENERLLKAIRAAALTRRVNSKKDKLREQILRWHEQGRSETWIAKRCKADHRTLKKWFQQWNLKWSIHASPLEFRMTRAKDRIIDWYKRRSARWIARTLKIHPKTVLFFLHRWDISVRQRNHFAKPQPQALAA